MCPFSRHLVAFSGTTALAALGLLVLMEFGALAEDSARLQYLTSEDQKWEAELELARGREVATRDIATALCDDRLTFTEAIDAVMVLAEDSPEWAALLRCRYCGYDLLPPAATDREIMIQYLRIHIESMRSVAESTGERLRVAVLSAHLACFGDGHNSLPPPLLHK